MPPVPVILVDKSYWTRVINFETLAAEGMIDPADLDLFSCSRPRDANEPDVGLREAKRNRQRAAQWWSQYRGTASR